MGRIRIRKRSISRKVLICIIVVILTIIMIPGLDMITALIISLGFGTSISLWCLSFDLEKSIS